MSQTNQVNAESLQSLLLSLVAKGHLNRSVIPTISYSDLVELAANVIDPIPISISTGHSLTPEQEAKFLKLAEDGIPGELLSTMPGNALDAYFAFNYSVGQFAYQQMHEDDVSDLDKVNFAVDVGSVSVDGECDSDSPTVDEFELDGLENVELDEDDEFDSLTDELEGNEKSFRLRLVSVGHTQFNLKEKTLKGLKRMVERYVDNAEFLEWTKLHQDSSDLDRLERVGMSRGKMSAMNPATLKLTRWKLLPIINLADSPNLSTREVVDRIGRSRDFQEMQMVCTLEDLELSLIEFGFKPSSINSYTDQRICLLAWLLDLVDRSLFE